MEGDNKQPHSETEEEKEQEVSRDQRAQFR